MSIRLPNVTVLDYNDTGNVGATSVVSKTFNLPQDLDSVTMKIHTASVNGTTPTVDVYFQSSDDGGTTYYDVARVGLPQTVTASVLAVTATKPIFVPISTSGNVSSVIQGPSVRGLAVNQVSGLPILGIQNRVQISYGGTITTNNGVRVKVTANQQSPTA